MSDNPKAKVRVADKLREVFQKHFGDDKPEFIPRDTPSNVLDALNADVRAALPEGMSGGWELGGRGYRFVIRVKPTAAQLARFRALYGHGENSGSANG